MSNSDRGKLKNKKDIIKRVHERIDGEINIIEIEEVVDIICDYIIDSVKNNNSFTVNNFGTISVGHFHGHSGIDVSSGEMQKIEPFMTVKFYPHDVYIKLAKESFSKH